MEILVWLAHLLHVWSQSQASQPGSWIEHGSTEINGAVRLVLRTSVRFQTRIPVYFSHLPVGAAKKNVAQFAQFIRASNFRRFDYGPSENRKRLVHTFELPRSQVYASKKAATSFTTWESVAFSPRFIKRSPLSLQTIADTAPKFPRNMKLSALQRQSP